MAETTYSQQRRSTVSLQTGDGNAYGVRLVTDGRRNCNNYPRDGTDTKASTSWPARAI